MTKDADSGTFQVGSRLRLRDRTICTVKSVDWNNGKPYSVTVEREDGSHAALLPDDLLGALVLSIGQER